MQGNPASRPQLRGLRWGRIHAGISLGRKITIIRTGDEGGLTSFPADTRPGRHPADWTFRQIPPPCGQTPTASIHPQPATKFRHARPFDPPHSRCRRQPSVEGARVVEDFTRFVLDDAHLTRLVKTWRHDLAAVLANLPRDDRHALRDTPQDVGTSISTPAEATRADNRDVAVASCERVKQSLRSLEEFSKPLAAEMAPTFEALRYRWYTLEKALTSHSQVRGNDQLSDQLSHAKLCVLVDGRDSPAAFRALAAQLLAGGVGMIQLRDKQLTDRELVERARILLDLARAHAAASRCLVIINDRVDIAAATHADGVHLGQDDLPVKAARTILGPRSCLGVSTHSLEQARAAVLDGANYLGVGPTFPSQTKSFADFPGTKLLAEVAAEISLPAFAIGGITPENLPEVLATGIHRVAVSAAVVEAEDPAAAAQSLQSRL